MLSPMNHFVNLDRSIIRTTRSYYFLGQLVIVNVLMTF
jgi:hypothetical protein